MNALMNSLFWLSSFRLVGSMGRQVRRISDSLRLGLFSLAIAAAFIGTSACGGGGGGGGGGGTPEIQVLQEVTFLLNDGGTDPRTGHLVQFILREISNPDDPLTSDDIVVRRNGVVDVEARVRVNPPDIEKSDLTLILDVSSSLSPSDLKALKASAKDFADDVLPLASTLRIYYFSSPSQTQLLGSYEATPDGSDDFVWSPDPSPDIDSIPGGDNSTALFHSVRKAILDDAERDDILVVFSDGQENSSPLGAREEALALITDERIVVFSVGFGNVDSADLRELSDPFGAFLGVRPSLVGLFAEVARLIQSVYAVVYDTPTSFGTQELEFLIEVDRRTLSHVTSIEAGVDFARNSYVRYPSLPGSTVVLTDLAADPAETLTYTVLPTDQALVGVDELFAFAIEPTHICPGIDCVLFYQGPFGEGAQSEAGGVYLPAELVVGVTWTDPITSDEFMFTGFEELEFFNGTPDQQLISCARVTFDGGTHWFARELGLVQTKNDAGDLLLELAAPPCLADSFDGGCTTP
jgi:hypothetical protein